MWPGAPPAFDPGVFAAEMEADVEAGAGLPAVVDEGLCGGGGGEEVSREARRSVVGSAEEDKAEDGDEDGRTTR